MDMTQLTALATGVATASATALAALIGYVAAEWYDHRRKSK